MSAVSDESLAGVLDRLTHEFHTRVPYVRIIEVVQECQVQLCCAPQPALPELVERLARQRLNQPADRPAAQLLYAGQVS